MSYQQLSENSYRLLDLQDKAYNVKSWQKHCRTAVALQHQCN